MGDYKLSCMPSMHSYYDVSAASKDDMKLLDEDLPVSSGYQDSATNLWSNLDTDTTAATLLQNLQSCPPQQNGGGVNTYNFPPSLHNTQQFPPSSNTSSLQRRAITAAHNFPNNRQTSAGPNMFVQGNKSYPSSWSQQQQNPAWSWSRGRSVPGSNPIPASLTNRKPAPSLVSQQMISPKFRRSTSYPGKQHMFQSNSGYDGEDSRDLMLPYQDRMKANGPSPLDNMRNLEHYLNEISTGDSTEQQLKGFINCNSSALHSLAQIHGRSPYISAGLDDPSLLDDSSPHLLDSHLLSHHAAPSLSSPSPSSPHSQGSDNGERFSRKVFVGGLPPDIDEEEITASFRRFGPLVVDWPHKAESKSYFPPKGYAFLLFQDESSVQQLIDACIVDEDKCYLCVSSPTIKDKPVQIRPWKLTDADFVLDASMPLDPRKTVFVGGVPRPLKALELAMIMDRLYGGVCYAGIDTDPELKYPKGAGRVAFASQASYIAAISARFVQLQHGEIDKRVEVKPYVLDDQMCDECQGVRCGGKFAPFFCANVCCLQYYCEHCWATIHSKPGREFHKPLVKEGADRPRTVPFRW